MDAAWTAEPGRDVRSLGVVACGWAAPDGVAGEVLKYQLRATYRERYAGVSS